MCFKTNNNKKKKKQERKRSDGIHHKIVNTKSFPIECFIQNQRQMRIDLKQGQNHISSQES